MNQDIWLIIFDWVLRIGFIAIAVALIFLVAMFLIATAAYVFPAKQVKIDLKKIAETEIESRIYLDEYQFTIANQHWQEKIDNKASTVKDLDNKIRKKSAELKSITAAVESKPKVTKITKKKT